MRICLVLALSAALSVGPVAAARADVQIAMREGRVTLSATGATVREILAAWAKVGQTRIVNGERIGGEPLNLQLQDIPEEQALEIILRSVSGYLAAPRANAVENASRYDRLYVMPTSTPPRTAPTPPTAPPVFPRPTFNPLQQPAPAMLDEDDDASRSPVPVPRGPQFSFPEPGATPQLGNVPANSVPQVKPGPTPVRGPAGVAVPGMGVAVPGMVVAPPPAPPGVQPGQP